MLADLASGPVCLKNAMQKGILGSSSGEEILQIMLARRIMQAAFDLKVLLQEHGQLQDTQGVSCCGTASGNCSLIVLSTDIISE